MNAGIAVVGDTHGNMSWLCNDVIPYAVKHGCDRIMQVGDFGFVWPATEYRRRLTKLNRVLDRAGLDLLFLPGNHEDHTELGHLSVQAEADGAVTAAGHYLLRPRIAYVGRVSSWTWGGRRFAAVGGAVSIDRDWRVEHQRRTGVPIWWPAETLTGDEMAAAVGIGPVDVLFTHDAPTALPLPGLKDDLDSTINRQAMSEVGRALRPAQWFHGHYHHHVQYSFRHDSGTSEVTCLDRDWSPRTKGVALLDAVRERIAQ